MTPAGIRANRKLQFFLIALFATTILSGCSKSVEEQLADANEQVAEKEYSTAVITLRNILRDTPENADARLLLGESLMVLGDPLTADKEFSRAFELGANSSRHLALMYEARLQTGNSTAVLNALADDAIRADLEFHDAETLRGKALLGLGSNIEAEEAFRSALGSNPASAEALRGLAASLLALNRPDDAKVELNRLTSEHPDYPDGWLLQGQARLRDAELEQAEVAFSNAVEATEVNPDRFVELQALSGLADAQLSQDKIDAAASTTERLKRMAPGAPVTRLISARLAIARQEFDEAAVELEELLSLSPDNLTALYLYGSVQVAREEYVTAVDVLGRVVSRTPQNLIARRLLAQAQMQVADPAAAVETLTPLLESEEIDATTAQFASNAMIRSGAVADAIAVLEEAVENAPTDVELKLALAAAYLQAQRGLEAVRLAESLPEDDENFRRDLILALGYAATNRTDEADSTIIDLMARFEGDAQALVLGADYFFSKRDFDTARTYYRQVLDVDPVNTNARLGLARIAAADGNMDEAKQQFQSILNESPGNLVALLAMANFAGTDNDLEEAERLLIRAAAANETAALPRMMLARLYLRQGNNIRAEQVSQEAARMAPQNAAMQLAAADILISLSKIREALSYVQQATEIAPESPDAWFILARTQLALQENAKARDALNRLLLVKPDSMRGLIALALIEISDGNENNAMGIVRNLKDQYPDEPAPLTLEADINMLSKRYAKAAELYRQVFALAPSALVARRTHQAGILAGEEVAGDILAEWVENNPEDRVSALFLAEYNYKKGESSETIRLYEQILEGDPENIAALNNLAWNYFKAGDVRAEDVARRAYGLRPDIGSVADTLGWILVRTGNLEEGARLIEQAAQKQPNSANITYHLAYTRQLQGNPQESLRLLNRILEDGEEFDERENAEALKQELEST